MASTIPEKKLSKLPSIIKTGEGFKLGAVKEEKENIMTSTAPPQEVEKISKKKKFVKSKKEKIKEEAPVIKSLMSLTLKKREIKGVVIGSTSLSSIIDQATGLYSQGLPKL
jgi:hypothetical protein